MRYHLFYFRRAMLCRVRLCYGRSTVRLSVCDVDVYLDHYSFAFFENNYVIISLKYRSALDHPEIPSGFLATSRLSCIKKNKKA